jgi:hypothetical protein
MGFLDEYSGTHKYEFPARKDGKTYWVELRKTLLQGDKAHAERALTNGRVDPQAGVQIDMDTATYRHEMVLASVIAWNLDDDKGVWPVTLNNVMRIPGIEFDAIYNLVNEFNSPRTSAEKAQFRPEGERGDQVEANGREFAVIPGEVLHRD